MKRSPLLPSLHQTIDEVAASLFLNPPSNTRQTEDSFERQALLETDALLAFLYKDHADAVARYTRVVKDHGNDSPMAIIADDLVDSAKSAFETRLIEVRNDEDLVMQARHIAQKKRRQAREERRKETALYNARMFLFARQCFRNRKKQQEKEKQNSFILFLLWIFFMLMEQRNNSFSPGLSLCADFGLACRHETKQAA